MTSEAPARAGGLVEVLQAWDDDLRSADPLRFPAYRVPGPGEDPVRTARVALDGAEAVWVDCDFRRSGGTMGAVAGERIVRAYERATQLRLPVVATVSTGGARLQEGMVALVQMTRTASAAARHARAGLLSAAYLGSPTTGGVFASWASLAGVRAAAPGAVIGFGGPRVVAQVTGEAPPSTSHTAESALRHGLVDAVVPESDRWAWLAAAVGGRPHARLVPPPGRPGSPDPTPLPADPYEHLLRARGPRRPGGVEWASWVTDSWVELAGADPAMRAGLGTIAGERVVVVAMDRFAGLSPLHLPGPGAFRLVQRAARLAGRVGLPLVTFVDTPGADPAPDAEAGGVAGEIADTLLAMAELATVSVAVVVGEGGSGGAMALAHADRLLMLEGSVFSVIGPEAGAAILYRDASRAPELTRSLRMTSGEVFRLGVADDIVGEEPELVRVAVQDALATATAGARDVRTQQVTARALAAR
ncbi:carboxyl transferase domain-containing protein [Pseudonocardia kunmingensis]|uniref:Acetyl-coenzyme A carboxylase carboxyl transferase subunits beta/alpha n=1 Tax=Pseudonocardia kunmingensis TaxID=630975 RepID=A0A543DPE8_9PSEU|nr:carboxyl transferase domain-containing protein [Pseudonocardia kunmingensis]TQM11211.1 acetyl-CoA carboxylase carboxyl transferase subunit beta [Pseudonocardia kunmingensis]